MEFVTMLRVQIQRWIPAWIDCNALVVACCHSHHHHEEEAENETTKTKNETSDEEEEANTDIKYA